MATINRGSFSLNLGFVQLGGDLSEDDRQCAWELYTEIVTRVAVVGKRGDKTAENFEGELYSDSLDSLYSFFAQCRVIMRNFPVARIKDFRQEHLGVLISRVLACVLRPFLEKWNGRYRAWLLQTLTPNSSPYELQKKFPNHTDFLNDWTALRIIMRHVEHELAGQYKLVPLD